VVRSLAIRQQARRTLRPRQTRARLQAVPLGAEVARQARAGAMPTAMPATTRCRAPIATSCHYRTSISPTDDTRRGGASVSRLFQDVTRNSPSKASLVLVADGRSSRPARSAEQPSPSRAGRAFRIEPFRCGGVSIDERQTKISFENDQGRSMDCCCKYGIWIRVARRVPSRPRDLLTAPLYHARTYRHAAQGSPVCSLATARPRAE
jgi:hypothetical protein